MQTCQDHRSTPIYYKLHQQRAASGASHLLEPVARKIKPQGDFLYVTVSEFSCYAPRALVKKRLNNSTFTFPPRNNSADQPGIRDHLAKH